MTTITSDVKIRVPLVGQVTVTARYRRLLGSGYGGGFVSEGLEEGQHALSDVGRPKLWG